MNLKNVSRRLLKNTFALLTVAVMALTAFAINAHADAYGTFFIKAQLPENQVNSDVNYYDLMMSPSQEQTLVLEVHNTGDEAMIANIELNNGATGENAVKLYDTSLPNDSSMKHPLNEMAKLATNEVRVEAKSKADVTIQLKMPSETFDGVSVGGIKVSAISAKEANTQNAEKESEDVVTISNELAFVLGLQLRMTDSKLERNLNLLSSQGAVSGYLPTISATIQNDQAILMNSVKINGTLKKKGGTEIIGIVDVQAGGILPNTTFDVVFDLNEKRLEAGEYEYELTITHEDREWKWNESVEVKEQEAKDIDDQSLLLEDSDKGGWVKFLIGGLAIIIVALLIYIFMIIKKKKKEDDEYNEE